MADLRPHVLCIDDDRETVGLIAEELTDRGFQVSVAFDGEQGFQAILAKRTGCRRVSSGRDHGHLWINDKDVALLVGDRFFPVEATIAVSRVGFAL